ncbi:hypothetical protein [Nocardia carnea]|uniref:hypothetical protein n=1 Tax=Nocardia carnea TaxID=37328 RepID=UPI002455E19D|nr:hypothetical protein [Nocardia carnea]
MEQNVRIDGDPYRVIGRARLAPVSRACYGKYRFTLRRMTDGTLWTTFGTRISPASELVRQDA